MTIKTSIDFHKVVTLSRYASHADAVTAWGGSCIHIYEPSDRTYHLYVLQLEEDGRNYCCIRDIFLNYFEGKSGWIFKEVPTQFLP